MTNSKYTYADFAKEVMGIASTLADKETSDRIYSKAQDLLNAQIKKAEYNASHPKKNVTKGASSTTMDKANAIAKVLTTEPMTTADINAALGTDYTALQVANAVKYIPNTVSSKVIRTTVNAKGLSAQKEYTAYHIE